MGSPAIAPTGSIAHCAQCGTKFNPGDKFCPKCGASSTWSTQPEPGATEPGSLRVATSPQDDIVALEQIVARNPDDESYRKLLAVALHDDAMKDWWKDPKDGHYLCTSARQIHYARKQIDRALALNFNDPKLRVGLEKMRQLVDSMEKREYVGSWFHVVFFGLFYIFPGVIWWYVNRRPSFLLNRDYIKHVESGKEPPSALSKMGGAMEKVSNFLESTTGEFAGGFMALALTLATMVVLSPIFLVLAYKQNYLDVKREYDVAQST